MQTRTALAVILATSLGLALPMPAASEPIRKRNDPAAAIARVTPGTRVRVEDTKGRVWEGRYIATTDGAVVLDDPLGRVPSVSIRQVWIRGRATRSGAIIGGVLLGLSKAALAAFGAGFQCEGCQGAVHAASARGFVVGAGIGALAGGLVGAAFPTWHRLDPDRPTATRTRGVTHDLDGRLDLAGRLPGGLAPGVEFGRTPNFTESVTQFGFSFTKARDHGRLRPYVLARIGRYSGEGVNDRDSLALQGRFHGFLLLPRMSARVQGWQSQGPFRLGPGYTAALMGPNAHDHLDVPPGDRSRIPSS